MQNNMTTEVKKGLILLKSLIFHYHGLDQDEQKILEKYVKDLDAWEEYKWASEFIAMDYLSAFERSKEFLGKIFNSMPEDQRLEYLMDTWESNHQKGYVTEMETTAMLNLAKDWEIEKQFMHKINES